MLQKLENEYVTGIYRGEVIEIFLVLFHVKQFFGVLYHNLLKPLVEGGRLQVFWITQKLKKNGKNKRFFFQKS